MKKMREIRVRAIDLERLDVSIVYVYTEKKQELEECRANARLIAAAPDLLDALKDCLQLMKFDLEGLAFVQPELKKAMAAIEKATGEQA